jgi:hypothetical protein
VTEQLDPDSPTRAVLIRAPESLWERVRAADDRPLAECVREALVEWLEGRE